MSVLFLLYSCTSFRQSGDPCSVCGRGAAAFTDCCYFSGALQGELQAQALKHTEEVFELREQVSRLTSQEEKWAAALQDRAQEEKTTMQLLTDLDGVRELLQSHRTENTELSKEVLALRRSLHQSEVEAQAMREELSKAGSQSASSMNAMDDKIRLLKEVCSWHRSLYAEIHVYT